MNSFAVFSLITIGISVVVLAGVFFFLKKTFLRVVIVAMLAFSVISSHLTFLVTNFGAIHLFWVIPIGIILLLASVLYIVREIRQPFFDTIGALESLAEGDLDIHFNEKSMMREDEIGRIYRSLEYLVVRTNQVSSFALEIGNGNLSAEFEESGDEDILGMALLKMRNNLRNVMEDTKSVVRMAVSEGKLQVRMETLEKEGVWKELSEGLNDLLISFSEPLVNLNNIILSMSQGDLSLRYTADAKGDILKMAENLNSALDNIDGLLSQVSSNVQVIDESSNEMKVSSEEMSTNTKEIATSISEMSSGAQTQVAKVDEASSLIEGILRSSTEMGSKAETIHHAAQQGQESSEKGLTLVNELVNEMDQISMLASKTNESINVLKERSDEITRVLGVITDIASQTNLLALNAAIEAAQAGDAGRGFAVVAEEIRKLAEDSKKSAKEIETLIWDVQSDTAQAATIMEDMVSSVKGGERTSRVVSSSFKEILDSSNETLLFSEEILVAAGQQNNDINNIVGITQSIVVIAEQTAAGTEEIAASAQELSVGMGLYSQKTLNLAQVAESFKEGISMLKLSDRGSENRVIFKMKEAYEKEKSLLDALLNTLPDLIYFKDIQSKFIRVSNSMLAAHKLERMEEIIGKSDFDFHGQHAQEAYNDEQEIIRTQKPLLNKVEKEDRKNGEIYYVSTTKLPLVASHGEVIGTFGISRDVTESKLAEHELQERARKLEECQRENEQLKKTLKDKED